MPVLTQKQILTTYMICLSVDVFHKLSNLLVFLNEDIFKVALL